jgi:acetyl esterase/lipase
MGPTPLVVGDSAGGGLAAGVAILARDRGFQLARQILVYPMLDDDRTLCPVDALVPFATWTCDNNYTGWSSVLGEAIGEAGLSAVAGPARLQNFEGLAAAYVEP